MNPREPDGPVECGDPAPLFETETVREKPAMDEPAATLSDVGKRFGQ